MKEIYSYKEIVGLNDYGILRKKVMDDLNIEIHNYVAENYYVTTSNVDMFNLNVDWVTRQIFHELLIHLGKSMKFIQDVRHDDLKNIIIKHKYIIEDHMKNIIVMK